MRLKMTLVLSFVVLLSISLPPRHTAFACYCLAPDDPREAQATAAAVFLGQVVQLRPILQSSGGVAPPVRAVKVVFQTVQWWKGGAQHRVAITTFADSASCGYEFELGEQYLVYAEWVQGELRTFLCSGTLPRQQAGWAMTVLGPPVAGAAEPDAPLSAAAAPKGIVLSLWGRSAVAWGVVLLLVTFIVVAVWKRRRSATQG